MSSYALATTYEKTKKNFLGSVHERLISANPGLKFYSVFCILPSYVVFRLTFCVIIIVSWRKGTTVFCKLELHVLM